MEDLRTHEEKVRYDLCWLGQVRLKWKSGVCVAQCTHSVVNALKCSGPV